MGVVSVEVMEEDWDFERLVVANVAGSVSGNTESSSQVLMIPHIILVLAILSILPGIEFEGSMPESTIH